jgi:glyoxylase-like metal-dependent hydrolase (beta-lactamase superfamily II)
MKNLTDKVYIITGKGLFSMPCFIVEKNPDELYMIDCGLEKDAKTIIKKINKKWGSIDKIKKILFTHRHLDHSGGLQQILDEMAQVNKDHKVEIICHKNEASKFEEDVKIKPTKTIEHETMIDRDLGLKAIHMPGHTFGHLCYFFEKDKIILLGDVVMDLGVALRPVFKKFHDDYDQWRKSLKLLLIYNWEFGVPTHMFARKIPRKRLEKFISKYAL